MLIVSLQASTGWWAKMAWTHLHFSSKAPVVHVEQEDRPTDSWNKAEIAGWLTANGADLSGDETKTELLDKVSEV